MEKVGIIGLGYVGLPLAVEFGKILDVVGFDINKDRIQELKGLFDRTKEVNEEELRQATKLVYSHDTNDLKTTNYFIITVPMFLRTALLKMQTPISNGNQTGNITLVLIFLYSITGFQEPWIILIRLPPTYYSRALRFNLHLQIQLFNG